MLSLQLVLLPPSGRQKKSHTVSHWCSVPGEKPGEQRWICLCHTRMISAKGKLFCYFGLHTIFELWHPPFNPYNKTWTAHIKWGADWLKPEKVYQENRPCKRTLHGCHRVQSWGYKSSLSSHRPGMQKEHITNKNILTSNLLHAGPCSLSYEVERYFAVDHIRLLCLRSSSALD